MLWCTLPTPYHLWENEYNWLFGNYEPENLDYDLETLHQWYDETYQRYCKDKVEERLVEIEEFTDSLTTANSTKAYWCLVKVLDGYDSKYYYGEEKKVYNEVQGFNGTQETIIGDDELGDLDGYKFIYNDKVIDYNDYNDNDISLNDENDVTIRINDYVYTNYTINDPEIQHKDIDYTRFWNITSEEQARIDSVKQEFNSNKIPKAAHMELFDIKAGDYSTSQTKYTVGNYKNSANCGYGSSTTAFANGMVKNWLDYSANQNDIKTKLGTNDKLLTLDGRIIAAFPVALLNEEDKTINDYALEHMNYRDYYGDSDEKYGKGNKKLKLGLAAGADKLYKYVDCVYEIVEENGYVAHQFVVPYMVIDSKWLHHYDKPNSTNGNAYISGIPNHGYFYACFTDNRYGQVYQKKYHTSEKAKKIYDNGMEVGYYVHRDDEYINDYISPIEPYTKTGSGLSNSEIKKKIGTLFGFYNEEVKIRLVSMRIYDKTFCDYNSRDGSYDYYGPDWWINYKNGFESKEINNNDNPLHNDNPPNRIIIYN